MSFPYPSPQQARILWSALTALAVGVLLALVGALLWGIGWIVGQLSAVLLPLAVAAIVACLLDPVVDWLENRGLPRTRAILCVFALATVVMAALAGSVIPNIVVETRQLVNQVPIYGNRLQQQIEKWITHPPASLSRILNFWSPQTATNSPPPITNAPPAIDQTTNSIPGKKDDSGSLLWTRAFDPGTLQSATSWLAGVLPKVGSWLFGQVTRVASWFGILAGMALIPVYAFYFLLEKRRIERNWRDYLPVVRSSFRNELIFVLSSINDCLITFFRGQVLVALCDGVLYTIGFFAIGLPYAFLLGAMATILTMIPFLGAIVTCATALIIAVVQFGDWLHPLLVLAVFGVVQALEGFVISPKIMGDRVGLHPLTIIIAVMVGTTLLGGIVGGILAIPLTAVLRAVMFRYVWRRRAEAVAIASEPTAQPR
jgi:predicted PurR-regulated permease PerM